MPFPVDEKGHIIDVQISDAAGSECLFTVTQATASNLVVRSMVEMLPKGSGMFPYSILRPAEPADIQAVLDSDYYVRQNQDSHKFWNCSRDESTSEKEATAYAKPRENADRLKWAHVKGGRIVE